MYFWRPLRVSELVLELALVVSEVSESVLEVSESVFKVYRWNSPQLYGHIGCFSP
jgi:hypothetical protein